LNFRNFVLKLVIMSSVELINTFIFMRLSLEISTLKKMGNNLFCIKTFIIMFSYIFDPI
jgi:hypothetical protein